jgi:hypothetical protein
MWLGWWKLGIPTKIWLRNFLENGHMEDQEADFRITLRWILGRKFVRMGGEWNWLRTMSNSRLWD